ncbi:MAG: hypothetical protein IH598_04865 [Bacteroidales bacterium]|nr:hypothetical protein [Bacteroidales bacterium]
MKNIYKILVFSFVLAMPLVMSVEIKAQSKAQVENVNFFVEGENLVITYDIVKASSGETFEVSVNIATTSGKKISAFSLQGDVGPGVIGGKYKRITWDLKKDNVYLDDEIEVEVIALSMAVNSGVNIGGALLRSAIFPGWGNSYVKGGGPYWLIGVVAYGTLGGSIYFNNQAYNAYEDYKNATTANDRDQFYNDAESHKNMQNTLAITTGAIWAIDLIWTAVQAGNARKQAAQNKVSLDYYYDPMAQQPLFRITYNLN